MKTGNEAKKSAFKYDKFSHGLDYLSFWLKNKQEIAHFFNDRIFQLDFDNSNFWAIQIWEEIFSINKYKWNTWDCYAYSVTFQSLPVPVFVITEFSSRQSELCWWQWGIIHFYWAYFRLLSLDFFSQNTTDALMTSFQDSPITRIDYAFDFFKTEEQILPTPDKVFPKMRSNKKKQLWQKWNRLQSWGLWNKMNKTVYIRLYNKKDELKNNIKKIYLYWDTEIYKTFFRLEYEFGIKFTKWLSWKQLPELISRIHKYTWLQPSQFKGNFYKPRIKLDLTDQIHKIRYVKMYRSMTKTLLDNWLNPISLIEDIKWISLIWQ